jgi:hypothetical protein
MPKVYITAPFTKKSINGSNKVYGEIKDESYKNFLEIIDATARKCGFQTVLPHRDIHEWGNTNLTTDEIGKKSFESLRSSDILIAYPEDSKGVNVVIGWASMLKKKIIILLNEKEALSFCYISLNGLTETRIVKFKDIMDMENKLAETLNDFSLNINSKK